MGAKRKVKFFNGEQCLEFESIAEARRYFGLSCSSFDLAVKKGGYKEFKIELSETTYHGMYNTSLYKSWAAMKTRCTNPNIPNWNNYGGRGITLYKEWYSFIPFMDWALRNGWEDGLTIERIDYNGNYEPDNCCWIPKQEQPNNSRRNRKYTINGKTKTITQWSREYGISSNAINNRLKHGWNIYDAVTIPPGEFDTHEEAEAWGVQYLDVYIVR